MMMDSELLQAATESAPLHASLHSLPRWQELLVESFTHIQHTRMQGVPVINPKLHVNADYFIPWQDYFLGVLVTPWFMNLMLLPASNEALSGLRQKRIGEKETHVFPSGPYEFIVGTEADLGRYLSCSLFSPMFDFSDQVAVMDTAAAVLGELMKEENLEIIDARPQPKEQLADSEAESLNVESENAEAEYVSTATPKGLSRRQLLTGGRS